jgi:hypothetical protein
MSSNGGVMPENLPLRPLPLSGETGPVTFGHLRREAKWMHLLCNVCGHEREVDTSKRPFDTMPDSTVAPTLGRSMVCTRWRQCKHPTAWC